MARGQNGGSLEFPRMSFLFVELKFWKENLNSAEHEQFGIKIGLKKETKKETKKMLTTTY